MVMASIPSPVLLSVGTLLDSYGGLTCSMVVARQRYGSEHVVGYESFEQASMGVLDGEIGSFLVPAAYPMLREFIMHPLLHAVESFVAPIVPLVVAVPRGSSRQHAKTLFLHPATEPLLPERGPAVRLVQLSLLEPGCLSGCVVSSIMRYAYQHACRDPLRDGYHPGNAEGREYALGAFLRPGRRRDPRRMTWRAANGFGDLPGLSCPNCPGG